MSTRVCVHRLIQEADEYHYHHLESYVFVSFKVSGSWNDTVILKLLIMTCMQKSVGGTNCGIFIQNICGIIFGNEAESNKLDSFQPCIYQMSPGHQLQRDVPHSVHTGHYWHHSLTSLGCNSVKSGGLASSSQCDPNNYRVGTR